MKKLVTLAGAVLALTLAPVASAVTISGDIHVNAFGGTATVDTAADTVVFSPNAPAENAIVSFATGDFASLFAERASYANFTYAPLSVDAVAGWAANTVWLINATTYFVLDAVTNISEGAVLGLKGSGTAYLAGFEPTVGSWSFSADSTGNAFTFSSTASVPEGGTTALLLGLALVGVAAGRRFKAVRS